MSRAPYGEMRTCETPNARHIRLANEARAANGLPPLDGDQIVELLASIAAFDQLPLPTR